MEEHLSPLAVTHLLQHTLRSLCIHDNSQWVYAVFWRILPRNYPPPKWDGQGGYDRSRGNRRNWILVWEDGFCNFAASTTTTADPHGDDDQFQHYHQQQQQGLQPELFFKMSHEIYNYGEGLIGKVAADHSHKWIYKEPTDQEINFLSAWHNSPDSHPRTWEAQFQSGIKTIALIAVREGVVQLGATHKVIEDLSYVVILRKKFSYIESIPGVLLPHPSSSAYPSSYKVDVYGSPMLQDASWHPPPTTSELFYHHDHCNNNNAPIKITPSMSSLEALLSKLPSVVPPPTALAYNSCEMPLQFREPVEFFETKEEIDHNHDIDHETSDHQHQERIGGGGGGGSSSATIMANYHHRHHHHQHMNVTTSRPSNGY